MLAYTCFVNSNYMYYRRSLDYFEKFIRKGNEDIILLDIEFKLKEIIISFENVETEEEFYKNIPINKFLDDFYHENINENITKQ